MNAVKCGRGRILAAGARVGAAQKGNTTVVDAVVQIPPV